MTLLVTRTAVDAVTVSICVKGGELDDFGFSAVDSSDIVTSFDTFAVWIAPEFGDIVLENAIVAIPEPSVFA